MTADFTVNLLEIKMTATSASSIKTSNMEFETWDPVRRI